MPKAAEPKRGTRSRLDGRSRLDRRGRRVDEVRDAALTLFARFGYHGTSMKDIAAALHLRAPSLYNHVAAKQHLLRDIIVETYDAVDRELRAAMASSDDVVEKLRRGTEAHVRYHIRHPRELRVANRELEHLAEPAKSQVRQIRRQFEELVLALIEQGVKEGRFSVSSPRLSAYAIFRLGSGVVQWYRPGLEFSDSEIAYYYADLALRMVGVVGGVAPAPAPAVVPPKPARPAPRPRASTRRA